ncbi:uncharacterized protein CTRU02_210721 [Colletotrichum truncatum]|uniref:Uncharacterized protein n=1 Tax=Colletotrichum truncatum TaxID=5467 RepID=A0ACC3YPZ8_COLTU
MGHNGNEVTNNPVLDHIEKGFDQQTDSRTNWQGSQCIGSGTKQTENRAAVDMSQQAADDHEVDAILADVPPPTQKSLQRQSDSFGMHSPTAGLASNQSEGDVIAFESRSIDSRIRERYHSLMQVVARKLRNHLSSHTLFQKKPIQDTLNKTLTCHRQSCQYLLGERQIEDVVEIVFREICNHNDGFVDSLGAFDRDRDKTDTNQTWAIKRPSCIINAIEPQISAPADPATTISEPQISFFTRSKADGQTHVRVRSPQASITTILSRDSITNIQWLADKHSTITEIRDNRGLSERQANESPECCSTPVGGFSASNGPMRASNSDKDSGMPDLPAAYSGQESDVKVKKQQQSKSTAKVENDDDQEQMISFPPLGKRHCTNEWQIPPTQVIFEDPDKSCLHYLGIDAKSEGAKSCGLNSLLCFAVIHTGTVIVKQGNLKTGFRGSHCDTAGRLGYGNSSCSCTGGWTVRWESKDNFTDFSQRWRGGKQPQWRFTLLFE